MEEELKKILPESYPYKIIEISGIPENFSTVFRLQCSQKHELLSWLSEFQQTSLSEWIVRRTVPFTRWEFRRDYVCQHSNHNKKAGISGKSTGCKAKMDVTIKKMTKDTKKKDGLARDGFATIIRLKWSHNHELDSDVALSYKKITKDVKDAFWKYFGMGMGVPAAKEYHESQLRLNPNFDERDLIDASIFPRNNQLYYLYRQWRQANQLRQLQLQLPKPSELMDLTPVHSDESDIDAAADLEYLEDDADGDNSNFNARVEYLLAEFSDICRSHACISNGDPNFLRALEGFVEQANLASSPPALSNLLSSCKYPVGNPRKRLKSLPADVEVKRYEQKRRHERYHFDDQSL